VVTPWTIRNYLIFHRLMPMRDNFGLEFWVGNHEVTDHSPFPLSNPAEYNQLGELQFMETKRQVALQFVRRHPREFWRLSMRRIGRFWSEPEGSAWPWISLLAWLGVLLALRRKGVDALPYLVVLLIFPLVYYVTHTFPTYRHPIEPVMLLLAAHAATTAAKIVRAAFSRKLANSSPSLRG